MEEKDNKAANRMGWEFTLPGYLASPLTWLLILSTGIALFLLVILLNKVITYSKASATNNTYIKQGGKMP